MHRHFLHLAYNGARYHGWQKQPHSASVQETIETALSTILNEPIEIVGCGRTDTGVHASSYVAHFDTPKRLPEDLVRRLNRILPADIAVQYSEPMGPSPSQDHHGQHARFSATHRAYRYDISGVKDPFRQDIIWYYYAFAKLDLSKLNEAARLLVDYMEFAPFCKTNSDARTMRCELRRSEWVLSESGAELHYHIAANRFLRGMVRLIVGACIQVAIGELDIEHLRDAMITQQPLAKPLSVPPTGLFLTDVRYA